MRTREAVNTSPTWKKISSLQSSRWIDSFRKHRFSHKKLRPTVDWTKSGNLHHLYCAQKSTFFCSSLFCSGTAAGKKEVPDDWIPSAIRKEWIYYWWHDGSLKIGIWSEKMMTYPPILRKRLRPSMGLSYRWYVSASIKLSAMTLALVTAHSVQHYGHIAHTSLSYGATNNIKHAVQTKSNGQCKTM